MYGILKTLLVLFGFGLIVIYTAETLECTPGQLPLVIGGIIATGCTR